jgi:8-oxo-dGTP diphosphatase
MIISSKIVLVNSSKEYLLYLRDDNPMISYPDYWDLFGGFKKEDESDRDTIERELVEEIDAKVYDIRDIGIVSVLGDEYNLGDHDVSLFKGKVYSPKEEITLNEGRELKYFRIEELKDLKFPYFYRNFIFENEKCFSYGYWD